jgi:endonuclease III
VPCSSAPSTGFATERAALTGIGSSAVVLEMRSTSLRGPDPPILSPVMSPQSTPSSSAAFRRKLLAWYRRAARDLPWRRTRDPYAVLVSEFMLQQTQVSRVVDYYAPFLDRYPTVRHLARARPSQVREAWEGLGYYRRAANLHRLARQVVAEFDGAIPDDAADLRQLPGVGAYTAAAVVTFAFERPAAAVDTNVARVLARVFAGAETGNGAGGSWSGLAPRTCREEGTHAGATGAAGDRPSRRGAAAATRPHRLGVQPGADGARRSGVHGAYAEMRDLSGAVPVPLVREDRRCPGGRRGG